MIGDRPGHHDDQGAHIAALLDQIHQVHDDVEFGQALEVDELQGVEHRRRRWRGGSLELFGVQFQMVLCVLRCAIFVEHDLLAFVLFAGVLAWIQGLLLFGVVQIIQIVVASSLAIVECLGEEKAIVNIIKL